MSGTIWLIVEDENDGSVVQIILKKRGIPVAVKILKPSGGTGGISRLAKQLRLLIETAKKQKKATDCIAVLHDYDIHSQQQNRQPYQQIEQICKAEMVKHVVAHDELESWMLSDSGLCEWLEIQTRNWDEQRKPSDELRRMLQDKKKMKYQGADREKVFAKLNGDGDKFSPSMRDALEHLKNATCVL